MNIIEEGEEEEVYVDEVYYCYCTECKKIKDRKDRSWSKFKPKFS